MMIWFLKVLLEVMATLVAYITNPIIVVFANEAGELPKWAKWWGTFDNKSLDVDWMVYEHCVPSWAEYDFNKHYKYHLEKKNSDGTFTAGYVDLIDNNFTFKEKCQRYVCRLCWLYRNCNYGFSYYVNGAEVNSSEMNVIIKQNTPYEVCICYEKGKNLWNTHWCIFIDKSYCKWFRLRVYLGWKLKSLHSGRHMLALFVSPFRMIK